jgi:hypothetical protein
MRLGTFGLITAAAAGTLIGGAAMADSTYTIDFESLAHGQVVDNQFQGQGVSISVDNRGGGPDLGVIFDSRQRCTADSDLEGPRPSGSSSQQTWDRGNIQRNTVLGNLLIIQEHGYEKSSGFISTQPDDEGDRPAGSIYFDFDNAIDSFGFDLVDVEGASEYNNGGGFFASFYQDGALLGKISFGDLVTSGKSVYDSTILFGDNSANRIQPFTSALFGGNAFNRVEISLGGSGAIDNVNYHVVPLPAAAWAGLGMLAVLAVGRRLRRKAAAQMV